MSYKTIIKNGALIIAASLLSLTACKKSDNNNNSTTSSTLTSADDNGGYASDAATAERTSNDVMQTADDAVTTNTTGLRTTSGYPVISRSYVDTDTIVTINFGPTPHLCADGRTRQGEIIVTFSGLYKAAGSFHTISYSNYYLDGFQVTGHKTVTNEGTNSSGQVWYSVSVTDSIILGPDSVITWTGTRTRTWLAGYATADRSDDVYLIGGTTTLTRANGHIFTFTISPTAQLQVALACRWIEAGTVTISSTSFSGGVPRTLNYTPAPPGDTPGGCDDIAQLTIGSTTYTITLY